MHVSLRRGLVTVNGEKVLSMRLRQALADRNRSKIRDILGAHNVLACRSCPRGELAMRVYPEPGWGITVICEPRSAGCGGAHSILLD